MTPDVLVIGSATVDMFAVAESGLVKITTKSFETDLLCFDSGSKITIDEMHTSVGGGGVNTAVDMTRLGLDVMFLGKIGKGNNGERVLNALKNENITVVPTGYSDIETGFSIILRTIDNNRTILAFKGANNELMYDEMDISLLDNVKWFYFASMVGESYKTQERLAEYAHDNNINIIFNPSSYVVKKGAGFLKRILEKIKILVVNLEEAQLLLGFRPNYAKLEESTINMILKGLIELGPEIVIITNGERKMHAYDGKTRFSADTYPAEIVDVAGAGDSFASGFLTGFMEKNDIEYGIRIGLASASSTISNKHTWTDLTSLKEAEDIATSFGQKGYTISKEKI